MASHSLRLVSPICRTPRFFLANPSSILLMAIATSFSEQLGYLLAPFATSSFGHHSMLSTISVIGSVLNAVFQPPIAKFADVFGRKEGFMVSIIFYVIGHILATVSKDIKVFAAARIFDAAGITGLKMMQQVFIADSSTLLNRMIVGSVPDLPFLITVWAGPPAAEGFRKISEEGWRWGYGIWWVIFCEGIRGDC